MEEAARIQGGAEGLNPRGCLQQRILATKETQSGMITSGLGTPKGSSHPLRTAAPNYESVRSPDPTCGDGRACPFREGMDLSTEAPTRTPQGFLHRIAQSGSRRAGVGAHDSGIDQPVLQVRGLGDDEVQISPYAPLFAGDYTVPGDSSPEERCPRVHPRPASGTLRPSSPTLRISRQSAERSSDPSAFLFPVGPDHRGQVREARSCHSPFVPCRSKAFWSLPSSEP